MLSYYLKCLVFSWKRVENSSYKERTSSMHTLLTSFFSFIFVEPTTKEAQGNMDAYFENPQGAFAFFAIYISILFSLGILWTAQISTKNVYYLCLLFLHTTNKDWAYQVSLPSSKYRIVYHILLEKCGID
jgi:hypothetical protein